MQNIFITGGSGYIGTRLIRALLGKEKYRVFALAREGSQKKIPGGCRVITGDALNAETYKRDIPQQTIFIHLIGVPHPSPSKKEAFNKIDLLSIREAVKAAKYASVQHFIYLSVAMYPTKIMKEFQQVRAKGEDLLKESKLKTSFIRPWYVTGPGHWWPILLKPFYSIALLIPSKKEAAKSLATITIGQMIATLLYACNTQPEEHNYYEVVDMKKM